MDFVVIVMCMVPRDHLFTECVSLIVFLWWFIGRIMEQWDNRGASGLARDVSLTEGILVI